MLSFLNEMQPLLMSFNYFSRSSGTTKMDPWVITPQERARFESQFQGLKPINGIITGDQAKGFFMLSQLPLPVLGAIW